MNIQHLKYAVEVARAGSISQAAERLYMNQPNLSKAVKELEASLGISIFKRTSKGMMPTVKGSEFLGYAQSILDQVEQVEALYRPNSKGRQSFRISVPPSSYIAYAFTSFIDGLERTRDIEVSFQETDSMRTIKNVVEDGCQLGIIRYQQEYEEYFLRFLSEKKLAHEEITEYELIVLMSANSDLAQKPFVSMSDLKDRIEVLHGDLSVPYMTMDPRLEDTANGHNKRIYVYERGSQFDLLSRINETYMWTSPMPSDILKRNSLVQRPCANLVKKHKDVLIYHSGYKLGKLDKEFMQKLDKTKELIQQEIAVIADESAR